MKVPPWILCALALFACDPARVQASDDPPVPVTMSEVTREALASTIPAAGTVHSRQSARVTAGMTGRLQWVVEPGEIIAAGQPIATFDCAMVELRLAEQEALAERERIRFESLREEVNRMEQVVMATSALQLQRSRADRDIAASEMRIAAVRIRQTRAELARCVETAPFAGVITQQLIRGGSDVAQGEMLAAITDTEQLEVRAFVPIRHRVRMQLGAAVEVRLGEQQMQGHLRVAVPAADSTSQTFEVRIDLPQRARDVVAAGQLVSLQLPLQTSPALTVPRDAVVLASDGAFVMRVTDNRMAEKVMVVIGDASVDRVAVRGALQPGDQVAVQGAEALDHGSVVTVLTGT